MPQKNRNHALSAPFLALLVMLATSLAMRCAADEGRLEPTPRQLYNDGTKKLRENK